MAELTARFGKIIGLLRGERQIVSFLVALAAFILIMAVNWEWTVASLTFTPIPTYDLKAASVIGFAATLSWVAFAIAEVLDVILGTRMRAEANEKRAAAEKRADRLEAELKAVREAAEAKNETTNGADGELFRDMLNHLADERAQDRAERERERAEDRKFYRDLFQQFAENTKSINV